MITWLACCGGAPVLSQTLGTYTLKADVRLADEFFDSPSCTENLDVLGVQVQSEVRAGGEDLIVTIQNKSINTIMLPVLHITGFDTLSHEVSNAVFLDHTVLSCFRSFQVSANGRLYSLISRYPEDLYSPVIVVRDSDECIGVSLLYPITKDDQYNHTVKIRFNENGDRTQWRARFILDGCIGPKKTLRYTVAIRRVLVSADWRTTLEPYRAYFQSIHQDQDGRLARYERSTEPVFGFQVADSKFYHPLSNKRSFRGSYNGLCEPCNNIGWKETTCRPDISGWQSTVDDIICWASGAGYKNVMVWSAGGMYPPGHQCEGFPPHFMTWWPAAMLQTQFEWWRLSERAEPINLMFWWGNAAKYGGIDWKADCEPFDPNDENHASVMMQEWSLALDRGAVGLGLDAFTNLHLWDAIPWIERLQETAVRSGVDDPLIVSEPMSCDILHLYLPSYLPSYYRAGGDDIYVDQYHSLAEYLIPGNEIWCQLKPEDPDWTEADWVARAEELACHGYRVLVHHRTIKSVSDFYPPKPPDCAK